MPGEQIDLSSAAGIIDYADLIAEHLSQNVEGTEIDVGDGNTITLLVWISHRCLRISLRFENLVRVVKRRGVNKNRISVPEL